MTPPLERLSEAELRAALRACLSVQRWVDEVVAQRPFSSAQELLEAATAATPLSPAEIDEALAGHPRIGHRPTGAGAAHDFSRREQQASESDDEALARALADGNAAYEQKFGRIFLIRAASRDRQTIVAELQRRLQLDPGTEVHNVADELRDIALLRVAQLSDAQGAPL